MKFKNHIWKRGVDYFECNKVILRENDEGYVASVKGTQIYEVIVNWKFSKASCNCPHAASGNKCKHMAATLIAIQYEKSKAEMKEEKSRLQTLPKEELIEKLVSQNLVDSLKQIKEGNDFVSTASRYRDYYEDDFMEEEYDEYDEYEEFHREFTFEEIVDRVLDEARNFIEKEQLYTALLSIKDCYNRLYDIRDDYYLDTYKEAFNEEVERLIEFIVINLMKTEHSEEVFIELKSIYEETDLEILLDEFFDFYKISHKDALKEWLHKLLIQCTHDITFELVGLMKEESAYKDFLVTELLELETNDFTIHFKYEVLDYLKQYDALVKMFDDFLDHTKPSEYWRMYAELLDDDRRYEVLKDILIHVDYCFTDIYYTLIEEYPKRMKKDFISLKKELYAKNKVHEYLTFLGKIEDFKEVQKLLKQLDKIEYYDYFFDTFLTVSPGFIQEQYPKLILSKAELAKSRFLYDQLFNLLMNLAMVSVEDVINLCEHIKMLYPTRKAMMSMLDEVLGIVRQE